MSDDTIERLETRLMYLEDTVNTLQDVVLKQERLLDLMRLQHDALVHKVRDLGASSETTTPEQEIPPHY